MSLSYVICHKNKNIRQLQATRQVFVDNVLIFIYILFVYLKDIFELTNLFCLLSTTYFFKINSERFKIFALILFCKLFVT